MGFLIIENEPLVKVSLKFFDGLINFLPKSYPEKFFLHVTMESFTNTNRLLGCYLKRWSIEETIRFVKQTYDLENIRVLNYARLKNMMALLLAIFYFIAVKLDTAQKLKIMAGHVLKQAKRIFGIPDFKYYALGDGLSAVFKRSPGKIHPYKPPDMNVGQLTLGFT